MSFNLIGVDQKLVQDAQIIILQTPNAVSGFPLEARLPIQFPPRITDDVKNANWNEIDVASYEPEAIWMGSSARKVGIELTYIATGAQSFTTDRIAKIVKQVHAYFYRSIESNDPIPLVEMSIYNHFGPGSSENAKFRVLDSSVSHGDTIVVDDSGRFPMLTKIKFSAALCTTIDNKQKIQTAAKPKQEWY